MKLSLSSPRTYALALVVSLEMIVGGSLLWSLRSLYQLEWLNSPQPIAQTGAVESHDHDAAPPPAPAVDTHQPEQAPSTELAAVLSSVFGPLPIRADAKEFPHTPELVDLGRMLYFDPRLSVSQTMSCNSCHNLTQYGVDGLPRSAGENGTRLARNTPTVYNVALHIAQFWDGRAATVEEQVHFPILHPSEMGMLDPGNVAFRLKTIPGYAPLFAVAFPNDPDPVRLENVSLAIGAFERGLMTPSRFDRFLAGDYSQLNEQEQRGLSTFISLRCATCHVGPTVGGLSYKRLGEQEDFVTEDVGRFTVTNVDADRFVFKVPSLRNVVHTAPYMHDGSVATLEEMIKIMTRHQLGKVINDSEIADIIAFLHTLSGEIPADYIAEPELPFSSAKTLQPLPVREAPAQIGSANVPGATAP